MIRIIRILLAIYLFSFIGLDSCVSALSPGLVNWRAGYPGKKPTLRSELNTNSLNNINLGDRFYNPVIFVPGDGGSQLEARLNKTYKIHYICDKFSDWYDLWLNIHLLIPGQPFDCFSDNMKLHYNKTTRTTSNSDGVDIRPTKFGSLDGVDYLDIANWYKTDYFHSIIQKLQASNGYSRDVDMVGAPFDFRKAPNELGEFFFNLTRLIEEQYVLNLYKPVTIICHSMGCLNSLYLLNRQTDAWKEIYIKRIISLGAPWDGSFKAISSMLYGDNLGIPLLNSYKLQELQSTFPSLMYLFPKIPLYDSEDVLVITPSKNYTISTLDQLFQDTGLLDQREMWFDTKAIAANLTAPGVELWCLFGSGVDTPSQIVYKDSFESGKYEEIQSDGDGTVNLKSLRGCERFRSQQRQPVYMKQFAKLDHIDILRGSEAANYISEVILKQDL